MLCRHSIAGPSPVEQVLNDLERIDPKWRIEVGDPRDGHGWIRGPDFSRGNDGPFRALLERIAHRLHTNDKRTVAASFSLRFGWCAAVAIAPYIIGQCVPDVSLINISLKFREDTLFERTALLSPRGVKLGDAWLHDITANFPGKAGPTEHQNLDKLSTRMLMFSMFSGACQGLKGKPVKIRHGPATVSEEYRFEVPLSESWGR